MMVTTRSGRSDWQQRDHWNVSKTFLVVMISIFFFCLPWLHELDVRKGSYRTCQVYCSLDSLGTGSRGFAYEHRISSIKSCSKVKFSILVFRFELRSISEERQLSYASDASSQEQDHESWAANSQRPTASVALARWYITFHLDHGLPEHQNAVSKSTVSGLSR